MNEQNKSSQELILIFARIFFFIKKYFLVLVIFILAGIACGYFLYDTSDCYYKKHLSINSVVIDKDIALDLFKSLQPLVDEKNTAVLANKLNIPYNAAASILRIDTNSFRNKLNLGFIIDVTFSDSAYTDTLTSGFIFYLSQNNFYRESKNSYTEAKQKLLNDINLKLGISDSTDTYATPGQIIMRCASYNPYALSSYEEVNFLEKKYELEKEINGCEMMLVEDSTVRIDTGISMGKSILLYGTGFCILGIILIFIFDSIRQTRKYLQQHKG